MDQSTLQMIETLPAQEKAESTSALCLRQLPNTLTVLRILFCPLLFCLILFGRSLGDYILVYYLFVIAGLTDIYDGSLARRHSNVTTFGKLVDPIADKFLLAATLIPFYMLSESVPAFRFVTLPVLIILLGRELLVTLLRYYSMWAGCVFSASRTAKFKTSFQMFFIGSLIVTLIQRQMQAEYPALAFNWFFPIHDKLNAVLIVIVVGLSVVSAVEYVVKNLPLILRRSRA